MVVIVVASRVLGDLEYVIICGYGMYLVGKTRLSESLLTLLITVVASNMTITKTLYEMGCSLALHHDVVFG